MRILRRATAFLVAAAAVLLVYGVGSEPQLILDERRYDAAIPGPPARWNGAKVAVFSDLHVGMWLDNTGMVERVVDRVIAEDPAMVLMAGDFLYSTDPDPAVQIETILDLVGPLVAADLPTFAVLGNHDYHVGAADQPTEALERAGVEVLRNEAKPLPPPGGGAGQPLFVVGLGPAHPPRADPDQALSGVPAGAPRVVVMHHPTFPSLPARSAPLAVAGHTHCGQVAVPGPPAGPTSG